MKKVVFVVLPMFLVMSFMIFAGCANKPVPSSNSSTISSEVSTSTVNTSDKAAASESSTVTMSSSLSATAISSSSTQSVAEESNSTSTIAKYEKSVGAYSIGLSESDLLKYFQRNKTPYEVKKQDGMMWYEADGMSFSFMISGLASISVESNKYATSAGIRVGDSASKVKQLYGTNYSKDDYLVNNLNVLQYYDSEIYLAFWIDESQRVTSWQISTSSLADIP